MTYIDLEIPGDPAALHTLADWLSPKVSDQTDELHSRLQRTARESAMWWLGETGAAFRSCTYSIAEAVDPVDAYAKDAATVFRAYANRLERSRNTFDGYLDDARKHYLIVQGVVITMPPPPPTYILAPGQEPPPERGPNGECIAPRPAGWHERAKEEFERIAGDVGKWWGELDNWIDEHIVPLMGRITEFDALAAAFETLKTGNELTMGFLLENTERRWEESLKIYEDAAAQAKLDADTHRDRLRPGDPRVSSAAEKVTKPELVQARKDLDDIVGKIKSGSKILGGVGIAVDVVVAATDVMNGGSISSATVGLLGGLGGGALGAAGVTGLAALAGVTLPVTVVVGAVVLVGWGVSELAVWGWESAVPLYVREAIDAGDWGYVFQ